MNILTASGTVKQLFENRRETGRKGKDFVIQIDRPSPYIVVPEPVLRPSTVKVNMSIPHPAEDILVSRYSDTWTQTDPAPDVNSPTPTKEGGHETQEKINTPTVIVNNTLNPQFHAKDMNKAENGVKKARPKRRKCEPSKQKSSMGDGGYAVANRVERVPAVPSFNLQMKKATILERLNAK